MICFNINKQIHHTTRYIIHSMQSTIPRLILHPENIQYCPDDVEQLLQPLIDLGFIDPQTDDFHHYLAGKEFINLLSFLGCSPDIRLNPDEGDNYCSVSICETHAAPVLLGYTSTARPRCPDCKHKVNDWKQHFHEWKKADAIYSCCECQKKTAVAKLKWRQEAGYGRFSIAVNHIHTHEAVPAEKLLNTLKQISLTDWAYFYANN